MSTANVTSNLELGFTYGLLPAWGALFFVFAVSETYVSAVYAQLKQWGWRPTGILRTIFWLVQYALLGIALYLLRAVDFWEDATNTLPLALAFSALGATMLTALVFYRVQILVKRVGWQNVWRLVSSVLVLGTIALAIVAAIITLNRSISTTAAVLLFVFAGLMLIPLITSTAVLFRNWNTVVNIAEVAGSDALLEPLVAETRKLAASVSGDAWAQQPQQPQQPQQQRTEIGGVSRRTAALRAANQ